MSKAVHTVFPSAAAASIAMLLTTAAQAALTISGKPTQNVSCSGGVCTATAKQAVLNVTDLANLIASSPVTIQSGSQAQDIVFDAPFSWTSANGLTLDAYRSITVNKALSDAGLSSINLTTNDGGMAGSLRFAMRGHIQFQNLSSTLTINGTRYLLINTVPNLANAIMKNPSGAYALADSYDASKDGIYLQSPIPTEFDGLFEGLGNEISHLSIAPDSHQYDEVGLFHEIGFNGYVAGIRVNANISRDARVAGSLASTSYGYIENAFATGTEKGSSGGFFGGLVGFNIGTIVASGASSTILVTGKEPLIGGLVGGNGGPLLETFATGRIRAGKGSINPSVGGLVGSHAGKHLISQSFASGEVSGGVGASVGGLVGYNQGGFDDCYSTGAASGGAHAGGLVGQDIRSKARMYHSYSTGLVSGKGTVGGVIGFITGDRRKSKSTYWDMTTSGIDDPAQGAGNIQNYPGLNGLTDDQLKSSLPADFDPAVWAQNLKINNGYPYLIANPPVK